MLVFLDVDGVLNSDDWFRQQRQTDRIGHDSSQIDVAAVARLNRLCEPPGVEVVLSSTWRRAWPWRRFQVMLEGLGFRGRLVGQTPSFDPEDTTLDEDAYFASERGLEIAAWLERQLTPDELRDRPIVILDDDDDLWCLKHRLVRTTSAAGLQDEHVAPAAELLERPFGGLPQSAWAHLQPWVRHWR